MLLRAVVVGKIEVIGSGSLGRETKLGQRQLAVVGGVEHLDVIGRKYALTVFRREYRGLLAVGDDPGRRNGSLEAGLRDVLEIAALAFEARSGGKSDEREGQNVFEQFHIRLIPFIEFISAYSCLGIAGEQTRLCTRLAEDA